MRSYGTRRDLGHDARSGGSRATQKNAAASMPLMNAQTISLTAWPKLATMRRWTYDITLDTGGDGMCAWVGFVALTTLEAARCTLARVGCVPITTHTRRMDATSTSTLFGRCAVGRRRGRCGVNLKELSSESHTGNSQRRIGWGVGAWRGTTASPVVPVEALWRRWSN